MIFSRTLPYKIVNQGSGLVFDASGAEGTHPGTPLRVETFVSDTDVTDQIWYLKRVAGEPLAQGTVHIIDGLSESRGAGLCLSYAEQAQQVQTVGLPGADWQSEFTFVRRQSPGVCTIAIALSPHPLLTAPSESGLISVTVTQGSDPVIDSELFTVEPLLAPPFMSAERIATYEMWRSTPIVINGVLSMTVAAAIAEIYNKVLNSGAPNANALFDCIQFWQTSYDGTSGGAPAATSAISTAVTETLGPTPDWPGVEETLTPTDTFTGQGAR